MKTRRNGSYGSWGSPITADAVASVLVPLSEPRLDGDSVYWIEGRPQEGGRNVIVARSGDGTIRDVTPNPFNVRSTVHSYGGGAYEVRNRIVYFVNHADKQIYRQRLDQAPERITTGPTPSVSCRYADICVDASQQRLVAIREEHPQDGGNVTNTLVAIDLERRAVTTLDSGFDFYSSPALSPDGSKLAWLSWRHPNMPWISTFLNVAEFDAAGLLKSKKTIAGGDKESIFQPQWSPDNKLYFVSDLTDFWSLYRWNGSAAELILHRNNAEFGVAQWQFGFSTYAFVSENMMIYAFTENGMWRLGRLNPRTGEAYDYSVVFSLVSWVRATAKSVVLRYSASNRAPAIGTLDVNDGTVTPIKPSLPTDLYQPFQPYFSKPEPIKFPTNAGDFAYAFFYSPSNPDWEAPALEKPPLLVMSHGGPTAAADSGLDLSVQFWTSRGFAVLDVNYRGSTGYGRKYREKLDGQWGVADVADCISGARFLAGCGRVDGAKLAIRGRSAGGYTTLCALTFHNDFAVGTSYYGISDLAALATGTHKFESHYMDWLVEPYRTGSAVYHDRSPINFVEKLAAPVIFVHGEDDPVVPLNQATKMFDVLRNKNISTCLLVFQGEEHGFRQAGHIRRGLEAELQFYAMNLLRSPLIS